ncbi:MAG: DUF4832 domain-containing protein [Fibrobacteres bacterium]|nr:DUF4832 domain-containing protein [Fibrobacterota bacterium]
MPFRSSGRFHALAATTTAIIIAAPAASGFGQAKAASATHLVYDQTTEDFINPERGFFFPDDGITQDGLRDIRRVQKASVIRSNFQLDAYRNVPLPASFLIQLDKQLGWVRDAGLKVIVRFAYNSDQGQPDASLDRILSHIDQLAPVLAAHADILALVEAGFIGAWGEWHSSTNGLENDASRKAVLLKLLSALPAERMVAVRCNFYKRGALGSDLPLGPDDAFDGSPRSRVGAHNDCLGASQDDFGTYTDNALEAEKNFLSLDNRFVPQEGETCNPGPFAQCAAMLQDLRRMRWDMLNMGYHPDVLSGWKQAGCYPEIQTHLGYRFVLLSSDIQDSVRPGGGLQVSLRLANGGWGKAFNPRGLELVLREEKTKARYALPLKNDPRRWGAGDTVPLGVTGAIPTGMPPGRYRIFLNLPDPAPRLRNRPEYSIRLANAGLWEDSTGLNGLNHSVVVSASAGGPSFTGEAFISANAGGTVAVVNRSRTRSGPGKAPLRKGFDLRGRVIHAQISRNRG